MSAELFSLSCESFGVRLQLNANSDHLLKAMLSCAPLGTLIREGSCDSGEQFTLLEDREAGRYRLLMDGEVVDEGLELREIIDQLAGRLMIHAANYAPDRVFVHAGVVGWRGGAIVLPGTSFAGKTTLVAELVRAGAIYYSDEYAVLDDEGRVHPYARELQMRVAGEQEQRGVGVEELRGKAGITPLRVSHVVFANYVEGGRWNPEPMTAGMAVLEMLQHAIPVQRTPARVMATLAKAMEHAEALRSERGEAAETAASLLHAISG